MELCYEGGLVMPSSYAIMDEEEMNYVEGGFYVSNATLGAVACTFVAAFSANPQLVASGVMIVARLISAVVKRMLFWIGTLLGSVAGGLVGYLVGAFSGWSLATSFAKAMVKGKGLKFSWTGISVK
jgi:membrane protein YqaA with SNARE-associated domain